MFKIYYTALNRYDDEEFEDISSAVNFVKPIKIPFEIRENDIVIYNDNGFVEFSRWVAGSELTSQQAGFLLGVGNGRIREFIRTGRLKSKKFGKAWMIALEDLEEFAKIPRETGINLKENKNV